MSSRPFEPSSLFRREPKGWLYATFFASLFCLETGLWVPSAQADPTQGTSCTVLAAGAISGSTTGTSVVSPAGGNNLVCISGTWQYPAYQFGSTATGCTSTDAGAIQWTGSVFQGCNGSNWNTIGFTGSGITLGTSKTANNPQISGDASSGLFTHSVAAVRH